MIVIIADSISFISTDQVTIANPRQDEQMSKAGETYDFDGTDTWYVTQDYHSDEADRYVFLALELGANDFGAPLNVIQLSEVKILGVIRVKKLIKSPGILPSVPNGVQFYFQFDCGITALFFAKVKIRIAAQNVRGSLTKFNFGAHFSIPFWKFSLYTKSPYEIAAAENGSGTRLLAGLDVKPPSFSIKANFDAPDIAGMAGAAVKKAFKFGKRCMYFFQLILRPTLSFSYFVFPLCP